MKQAPKVALSWVMLLGMVLFMYLLLKPTMQEPGKISFSQFLDDVKAKKVKEVVIRTEDKEILGTFTDEKKFKTSGILTDKNQELLSENNVSFDYISEKANNWLQLLFNLGPMILFIFLIFMIFRQLQVGGGKAMSFGKSRAKLLTEKHQKVTFNDVAGINEAKQELEEIISFLKNPKKFTRLGGRIPKGVLLMGPPGSGKTLLARAIAGEAGVPFFSISGSDFVEMFVGVGASRVRDLFEQGKKNAPCIIFIDEIDAVGRHRGAGLGGGHDEREQTLNQLLVEMDGFESNTGVIIIAATNRPDVLDPALLRPGRFDRRVVVSLPDLRGREGILRVHTKRVPLGKDVDISVLSRGTPGFSGADLENLVNEAALIAGREDQQAVDMYHFEQAKDKVLMGVERKSMIISEEEKRSTAYHEAGHALVGKLLPGTDPIHKVTIIPRGMALGVTQTLPMEERLTLSKEKAENMIAFLMGGRIAEELVFNHQTTGAGNDIERSTELARKMVCVWGMSEKIGPITFGKKDENVFLGKEFGSSKNYSEKKAEEIDQEIKNLVERNYNKAKSLLSGKINLLHDMAKALLEREVLDAVEVDLIVEGKELPVFVKKEIKKESEVKPETPIDIPLTETIKKTPRKQMA